MAKTVSITITDIEYEEIMKDIEENQILFSGFDVEDYIKYLLKQNLATKKQLKDMGGFGNFQNISKMFEEMGGSDFLNNMFKATQTHSKNEVKKHEDEKKENNDKDDDNNQGPQRSKKTYTC